MAFYLVEDVKQFDFLVITAHQQVVTFHGVTKNVLFCHSIIFADWNQWILDFISTVALDVKSA